MHRGLPNTTTVTTSHCAFLFIHPNNSFQHRHCHTFASTFHTFTPSNVLFHLFMLNLLFAYPIYLIETNVGPTTHTYYTKFKCFKTRLVLCNQGKVKIKANKKLLLPEEKTLGHGDSTLLLIIYQSTIIFLF